MPFSIMTFSRRCFQVILKGWSLIAGAQTAEYSAAGGDADHLSLSVSARLIPLPLPLSPAPLTPAPLSPKVAPLAKVADAWSAGRGAELSLGREDGEGAGGEGGEGEGRQGEGEGEEIMEDTEMELVLGSGQIQPLGLEVFPKLGIECAGRFHSLVLVLGARRALQS